MHPAAWSLFILSITILPLYNVGSPLTERPKDHILACEASLFAEQNAASQLQEIMKKLISDLQWYNVAVEDILKPRYEAVELQNQLNSFVTLVKAQLSTSSNLKTNLADHETHVNVSLSRQEEQLSKLEHQLLHLENRWRNQTSELDQLKQLWNDLGNKSVERSAEVKVLNQSINAVDERLTQLEAKVEEQALAAEVLNGAEDGADDPVQEGLQEALNTQGRLEGVLVTLQKDVAELRAKGGGDAPVIAHSQADTLCKRLSG